MYRTANNATAAPAAASNKTAGNGPGPPNANTNNPSQASSGNDSNSNTAPSTIREIRSRANQPTGAASITARQMLINRRQAMSMERLNGTGSQGHHNQHTSSSASMHNISGLAEKDKSSTVSGSSNSINNSAASSPSRGSSTSSAGTLNRTASRVSRFRSAKAVFERLSSANNSSNRPNKPAIAERPKGTVASRYAAAAAARGLAGQQNNNNNHANATAATSSRSRMANSTSNKSPIRSQDSTMKTSASNRSQPSAPRNMTTHLAPSRPEAHPKPQPRVITTTTRKSTITASQNSATHSSQQDPLANLKYHRNPAGPQTSTPVKSAQQQTGSGQAKPPPKDLIDKIVLEIARNADNEHDANCTIQDLSNCDISGIPETLDFDKCFQDVEMMTEEEARKLLSHKSETDAAHSVACTEANPLIRADKPDGHEEPAETVEANLMESQPAAVSAAIVVPSVVETSLSLNLHHSVESSDFLVPASTADATVTKYKVRFSDEPVTIYKTHAVEDYDRRNDDIDPVAASAEYEIEKSRERDGFRDEDDDSEAENEKAQNSGAKAEDISHNVEAVLASGKFTSTSKITQDQTTSGTSSSGPHDLGRTLNGVGSSSSDHYTAQAPRGGVAAAQAHRSAAGRDLSDKGSPGGQHPLRDDDNNAGGDSKADQVIKQKDYDEFVERELSLKRILEQNLRDLQSQYYETIKQLDMTKSDAETKIGKLEQSIAELGNRYEAGQNELEDRSEQIARLTKELSDIKESGQILEKKYHRAKKIIKDMQSRDESFTRREQLYQQKLDEIEFELGVLISTIDKTIYDEGLRYFSLTDATGSCQRQHQTRLDVFGLIRQMLNNFNQSQTTQSAQIKQRIVSMLEQQLANLLALSNGATSVSAATISVPSAVSTAIGTSHKHNKPGDSNNHPPSKTINSNHNNNNNNNNDNDNDNDKHNQNFNYASHRLSQPNMPQPIGVGGQPTKIFHGIAPLPNSAALTHEPSPPQSVNSYPSTNSLNSLNNNNTNTNNNNNFPLGSKLRDLPHEPHLMMSPQPQSTNEDVYRPNQPNDLQVPFQTDEWHEKPVSEWTTHQVSTWLLALGLDQYISKFEDRNVNGQSLINLDSTVLKGLGVLNSADRNLLKKKIRELRVEMEKERKQNEKKLKENLKEKSKIQTPNQSGKQQSSWKKSLLS